ncbi:MAG TPA: ATP-binding protein [Allosphingosinicella sp.]|uniref:sensor histidine kinase n=1 Tax=Allosphingosinicella sp. TaxID=2823234 RepID=UPI002ED7EC3D
MTTADSRKIDGRSGSHSAAAGAFLAAAALAALAAQTDRPITSAIVFLFGVTLVGALEGIKGGLAGAIAASLVYNFFLSDPVYRFSLSSADELVPLLAFNINAIASALVAGRLRDRALAAERASQRIQLLMNVSERLQRAVSLPDVQAAVEETGASVLRNMELYAVRDGEPVSVGGREHHRAAAVDLLGHPAESWKYGAVEAFLLRDGERTSGVLVLEPEEEASDTRDHDALVSLINLAFQRCLALEELAKAELVKKSEEFKTALLSSVSHDLRTPLSAIAAAASSLRSYGSNLAEDVRDDFIQVIEEQCARLDRYTSNLLSLGSIQAGLHGQPLTTCDALEALGSAIGEARKLQPDADLRKAYTLQQAPVRADPVMLEQVFYNVIENALKYSPPHSPIIVAASADDGMISVRIMDEGCGVPEEDRDRVFERFYRGRANQKYEGSGLGLSIARGFTDAFGGSIELTSTDPLIGGTTVTIKLPLHTSPEDQ